MKNTPLPYFGIFNRKIFQALTRGSPGFVRGRLHVIPCLIE
jgi:hypothetical protein